MEEADLLTKRNAHTEFIPLFEMIGAALCGACQSCHVFKKPLDQSNYMEDVKESNKTSM